MPRFNEEDLYGQQTNLMNDVNKYTSANTANVGGKPSTSSNPYGFDLSALDSLMKSGWNIGKVIGPLNEGGKKIEIDYTGGWGGDPDPDPDADPDPDGGGGGGATQPVNSLLSKFIGELQVLDKSQRDMLLGFVSGGGGDKIPGVSSQEYANLFGVSEDYANRFQGLPNLSKLGEDIQNVYNYGNQQRAFEQRAAQEANISNRGGQFQGGMGFAGFGSRGNQSRRRSLLDTLNQRQSSVAEATASKYGQLLNSLGSQLQSGFSMASNILQENPSAEGQQGPPQENDTTLINGVRYIYIGGQWVNEDEYGYEQQSQG
tara:strand:+ start:2201 stop:3148 length:948 start_codon:yes stop_codon:yes gene_type:complete